MRGKKINTFSLLKPNSLKQTVIRSPDQDQDPFKMNINNVPDGAGWFGKQDLSEKMKDSSSSSSSNSSADPRQPSTARPYVPPRVSPQDLPMDYSGFLAMLFAVSGVMFRVPFFSISIVFIWIDVNRTDFFAILGSSCVWIFLRC